MPEKPNIVLDLDLTLICSCSKEEDEKYKVSNPDLKKKKKLFRRKNMDNYYMVFERPGLQSFLSFLFKNFNVSIWTAASKDYALFIIEHIILNGKKNRIIDWIFFSYHCDISKRIKKGTKDLSILWEEYKIPQFSRKNTVIIDDYDEVYKTQPGNCISISPFNFTDEGSEGDKHLLNIKKELKNMLKHIQSGKGKPAKEVNKKLKAR